jgi:hypothetical protein
MHESKGGVWGFIGHLETDGRSLPSSFAIALRHSRAVLQKDRIVKTAMGRASRGSGFDH